MNPNPETAAPEPAEPSDQWASPMRSGIGRRLFLLILAASALLTLALTAIELVFDYRRDLEGIERRLDEIERSSVGSLASSLWRLDANQLQLQLDGIVRLPDMLAAEVAESPGGRGRPLSVRAGEARHSGVLNRTMPIPYEDRDTSRILGTLTVTAALDAVHERLRDKAIFILMSQGISTFLISFFLLYIVHRVVTRHLRALARYLRHYDIRRPAPPLVLKRVPQRRDDELDLLVDAITAAQANLGRAYASLGRANESLKHDIAARHQAEDEVRHLNAVLEQRVQQRTAELEAANQELSAFTYSVSHDLRAPLRAIGGFSRLLENEYGSGLDEKAQQYLDRLRAGVRRMEELIEDLLRLSQITRQEMRVGPVALSALAGEVADEIRRGDPGRRSEWAIAPGLSVEADAGLLRVVLENLFANAWKYTARRDVARIDFGCEDGGGHPVFFVRDNGVGFDMAHAGRLFGAFQRLHSASEFPGSGIGLATVARIVERHGGRVWAEAQIDSGATFFFTLAPEADGHRHDGQGAPRAA